MGAVIKRMYGIPAVYQKVIRWVETYTRSVSEQVFRVEEGAYSISREWLDPTHTDPWHTLELRVVGPMPRLAKRTLWAIEVKVKEQQRGATSEALLRCNVGESVMDYFEGLVNAMSERWPTAEVRLDYEIDEEDEHHRRSRSSEEKPVHRSLHPVKMDVIKDVLVTLASEWNERWAKVRELPEYALQGGNSLDLMVSPRLFGPHSLKERGMWWGIATRDDDDVRMGRIEAWQVQSGETLVAYWLRDFPDSDVFRGVIEEVEKGLQDSQTSASMSVEQDSESEEGTKPWELIPDNGWDREAIRLWCKGHQAPEIAKRLNLSHGTIYNRISALRNRYPEAGIPFTRDKKVQ